MKTIAAALQADNVYPNVYTTSTTHDIKQDDCQPASMRTSLPPTPTDHLPIDLSAYDNSPPPDGGFLAWSQILASQFGGCITWGYILAFSVFQLYYREHPLSHLPASQISWIGSVQLFLGWTVSMPAGRLGDMGYVRTCYAVGGCFSVFGMMLTSFGTEFWHFLLCQGVLNGIGSGLLFLPAAANAATYFDKNRSLAMSVGSIGTSVGGVIFPAMVQYLVPKIGFPWAVRCCGFVAMVMCGCGLSVIRQRNLYKTPRAMVDLKAFKEVVFSVYCAAVFAVHFCLFPVMFYINSYAREAIGIPSLEAINFVLIANGVAIVCRPLTGVIADRLLGAINTYVWCAVGFSILVFGWIGVHDRGDMYAFAAVLGVVNGGCQGIFPGATSTLISEVSGDLSKMGTWMGMAFFICGIASLAGPPTMGAIIGASDGHYLWAQVSFGTLFLVGGALLFLAPRLEKFTKWTHTRSSAI